MATSTVVRARISESVKVEATHVLEQMGLSASDAIRMLFVRLAREKVLPFDIRVPNDDTLAAMVELDTHKGRHVRSVAELMAELNADD